MILKCGSVLFMICNHTIFFSVCKQLFSGNCLTVFGFNIFWIIVYSFSLVVLNSQIFSVSFSMKHIYITIHFCDLRQLTRFSPPMLFPFSENPHMDADMHSYGGSIFIHVICSFHISTNSSLVKNHSLRWLCYSSEITLTLSVRNTISRLF